MSKTPDVVMISSALGALFPMLVSSRTPQERLLALGKILVKLPKVDHQSRAPVQTWIRGSFDGEYIDLAHRFALAPGSYQMRCMVENTPLEQIHQDLTK